MEESAFQGRDLGLEESRPRNPPGELTQFKKESIARALASQKKNLVKTQVVQGKEFKGASFVSQPDCILFKDFLVNEPMVLTITLTNVSYSFNSFRVLPLKEEIRDFFDLEYKPPGRISAGMVSHITFHFLPRINKDINEKFSILSETGQVDFPLVCLSQKAIVRTDQPKINFEDVIIGEGKSINLILKNEGALPTSIIIKDITGHTLKNKTETMSTTSKAYSTVHESVTGRGKAENEGFGEQMANGEEGQEERTDEEDMNLMALEHFEFNKSNLSIGGYSEFKIPITFKPKDIGLFNTKLVIIFEKHEYSPPIEVHLLGNCVDVPIIVENQLYDMRNVILGESYREKLVFQNRGDTAMKIQISAPKEMKKFIEFNPLFGYIQGKAKFEIWCRLKVTKDIMTMCYNLIENNTLEVPLKLVGANQVLPVLFKLRAHITLDTLVIEPKKLSLQMYEHTGVKREIMLENLSELPQKLLFYPLPRGFSVDPAILPLELLPGEKKPIYLVYKATQASKFEEYLKVKAIVGELLSKNYSMLINVRVDKCPLKFSMSRIDFPSLQEGEESELSFTIKNRTDKPILCQICTPVFEICGLRLSPTVFHLDPKKTKEVKIEYHSRFKKLGPFTIEEITKPKEEPNPVEESKPAEETGKGAKKAAPAPAKLTKKQQQELELELQRQKEEDEKRIEDEKRRKEEIIKSFDMEKELLKHGGLFQEFLPETPEHLQNYKWNLPCYFKFNSPEINYPLETLFMEINTTTITQSLVASTRLLDFGDIAVGFKKVEEVILTNNSSATEDLHFELMPTFGGFAVLNAMRTIRPGQSRKLLVQFEPNYEKPFEEKLKVFTHSKTVTIYLQGHGVSPEVSIIPENGLIEMGGVIVGEKIEKSITLKNLSTFRLTYTMTSMFSGCQNLGGQLPITFWPNSGALEALEERPIKILFKPQRVSSGYFEIAKIDIPNQKRENILYVRGYAFSKQIFITLYQPIETLKAINQSSYDTIFDIATNGRDQRVFGAGMKTIRIEFEREFEGEKCIKKITFGSCKMIDPKMEKPSNFEIFMPVSFISFCCG